LNVQEKIALLWQACDPEFNCAGFVAPVETSGSYADRVCRLAPLGTATPETIEILCQVVDDFRRFVMIVDDVLDEDVIRNQQPAFWTVYGIEPTITNGNWYFQKAVEDAVKIGMAEELKTALRLMAEGVELEIRFEDPSFIPGDLKATWMKIVEKEAAFRRFIALALNCPSRIVETLWWDGVAAQILDDSLSALQPKDGREVNSDEKLGRLTYMRAFEITAGEAVKVGQSLKAMVKIQLGIGGK
jgi:geranylgeranyl pyrophosphate synthase